MTDKIKVLGLVHGGFTTHTVRVVEIAKALRGTGKFEILFSGNGPYMRFVEQAGFQWVKTEILSEDYLLNVAENEGVFGYYNEKVVEEQYKVESELLGRYKPDIIIRDSFRELSALVAKQNDIFDVYVQQANMSPYYNFSFIPMNMTWAQKNSNAQDMERLSKAIKKQFAVFLHLKVKSLGLDFCEKTAEGVDADLVLMPDSEILFPFYDMTPNYKYIGPLLVLNQKEPPEWKEKFCSSGKKKIIISGGTTGRYNHIELYKKAFDTDKYCIAIECPPEILPEKYLGGSFEISSLIEFADLYVMHGGIGSTYLGLLKGVPMIALYNHTEQQTNAVEIAKLGVGAGFDPNKVSPSDLSAKADELLNDQRVAKKLSKIAKLLQNNNSLELAVKYIMEGYEEYRSKKRSGN